MITARKILASDELGGREEGPRSHLICLTKPGGMGKPTSSLLLTPCFCQQTACFIPVAQKSPGRSTSKTNCYFLTSQGCLTASPWLSSLGWQCGTSLPGPRRSSKERTNYLTEYKNGWPLSEVGRKYQELLKAPP